MDTITITLLVLGIVLILAEPAMPGFFISAMGVFLMVLGLMALSGSPLSSSLSILAAFLSSFVMLISLVIFYRRYGGEKPPETTVASSLIGKKGIVKTRVIPHSLDGKVEIGNTMWSATADIEIGVGTPVVVVASEGVHVTVRRIEGVNNRHNI